MSHWTKVEAERLREDDASAKVKAQAHEAKASAIAAGREAFWQEFVQRLQSDVALFNAEFPDRPERQFYVESHGDWGVSVSIKALARGVRLFPQNQGIAAQLFDARLSAEQRTDMPPFQYVAHDQGLRAGESANHTPASLSEFLLKRML